MMQVVVNSLLTNYQRTGKGKTVLLIHGWADSLQTFAELQHGLSKSYDVVSLDLPGFGQSQAPNEVWNLDNYAKFVRAFLQKIVKGEVFAIVGHSNGGALAIRGIAMGELHPQRLVLLSSSGIRPSKTLRRTSFKVVAKVGKVATVWLPEGKKRLLRKKLYGVAGSDMLVAPHLQETFKATVRQDISEDAKKLNLPALLVYGANDKATPASDGQKLAGFIKNSKFEVLPNADHFVHQDQPDTILSKITEFLND